MDEGTTDIAGIEIPSTNPVFLTLAGIHVLLGLACVIAGATATLSQKRRGRHPRSGTIYFWCLAGVFLSAAGLAAVRWAQDYHLLVPGALLPLFPLFWKYQLTVSPDDERLSP